MRSASEVSAGPGGWVGGAAALGGLDRGSDRGVKVGGLAAGRILTVSPSVRSV